MQTKLLPMGDARGVRIPQSLIDEADLGDEIELSVEGKRIIIASPRPVRQGWDAAFEGMAQQGDDAMLIPEAPNTFDKDEWEW